MGVSSDDADGPQMLCSRIANGTYGTSYVINCFDFKFKKEYQSQKMPEAFSLLVSGTCCTYPHPRDPFARFCTHFSTARDFQVFPCNGCVRYIAIEWDCSARCRATLGLWAGSAWIPKNWGWMANPLHAKRSEQESYRGLGQSLWRQKIEVTSHHQPVVGMLPQDRK